MRIALDEQEVLALLRTAKSRSQRDFTMLLLTYRHGLRASEVAGIRLDDIENGHLTVARLKGSLRTCQPIVPHPGQPLLDEVRALREWLRVRPNDGSDYLFPSQEGWLLVPHTGVPAVPAACCRSWSANREAAPTLSQAHPRLDSHSAAGASD